ncbi:hypothetical protein U8Q02_42260 (plasmid) [Rhizobium leguminosarum]|nr:hypothetical protein U8Q02_42260 [Rhizobium leguminosarum]
MMTRKAGSHLYLGHHWPDGQDGVEIRVYGDDARGYYVSTVYDPAGSFPPDAGPFPTSWDAACAGADRHFVEFDPYGRTDRERIFIDDAPSLAYSF